MGVGCDLRLALAADQLEPSSCSSRVTTAWGRKAGGGTLILLGMRLAATDKGKRSLTALVVTGLT